MRYADMHCDTITALYRTNGDLYRNDLHNDLVKMKKGGMTGLNYCSTFVEDGNRDFTAIDRLVEHVRHIVKIGGIEVIGLALALTAVQIFNGNVLRVYRQFM